METIGGVVFTVPAHATVMIFGLSPGFGPQADTITAGTGLSREQGFRLW
jgi:hypothetical protein